MTKELRKAIEIIVANLKSPKKILEVGSRAAVNQEELSNLRSLFPTGKYIGIDMQKGPGVDMVADAEDLPFEKNEFDLVMCLETLEHATNPWQIVKEIERVTTKNGIIILSSQQNFPIHMHPSDYFRYTPYGLSSLIVGREHKLMIGISPPYDREVELNPQHVIVVAWNGKVVDEAKLKRALSTRIGEISGHKPYRHRLGDGWKILKRAFCEINFTQAIKFFR